MQYCWRLFLQINASPLCEQRTGVSSIKFFTRLLSSSEPKFVIIILTRVYRTISENRINTSEKYDLMYRYYKAIPSNPHYTSRILADTETLVLLLMFIALNSGYFLSESVNQEIVYISRKTSGLQWQLWGICKGFCKKQLPSQHHKQRPHRFCSVGAKLFLCNFYSLPSAP